MNARLRDTCLRYRQHIRLVYWPDSMRHAPVPCSIRSSDLIYGSFNVSYRHTMRRSEETPPGRSDLDPFPYQYKNGVVNTMQPLLSLLWNCKSQRCKIKNLNCCWYSCFTNFHPAFLESWMANLPIYTPNLHITLYRIRFSFRSWENSAAVELNLKEKWSWQEYSLDLPGTLFSGAEGLFQWALLRASCSTGL